MHNLTLLQDVSNYHVVGRFAILASAGGREISSRPNAGNSGVQFRGQNLPHGEVKGCQADIGKGWWGKLYEEHGRALLWRE